MFIPVRLNYTRDGFTNSPESPLPMLDTIPHGETLQNLEVENFII